MIERVPQNTEARDITLAAGGDHPAFERLYRSSVDRIHTLARRMVGEDVADDLTQEVFIRAWEKLGTFRGEARFGTWLHRLAVNHILSRRATIARRRANQVPGEHELDSARERPSTPGLRVDFEAAMERLPEGAREIFVLYDVEGYRHDEIAHMLGVSVGTSKSQLHRARMMLRKHLA